LSTYIERLKKERFRVLAWAIKNFKMRYLATFERFVYYKLRKLLNRLFKLKGR